LTTESREKVDQMINVVIKTGANETRKPEDHGCTDVVFRILMTISGK
jgi:predicted lactoylglutathione lyase